MVLYQCRGNPNHDKCKAESTELGRCEKSPLTLKGSVIPWAIKVANRDSFWLKKKKKTKPLYSPHTPLVFLSVV